MSEEIVIPKMEEKRIFSLVGNGFVVEIVRWQIEGREKFKHLQVRGPWRWNVYALINSGLKELFELDRNAFPFHGGCSFDETRTVKNALHNFEYASRRVGSDYSHWGDEYLRHQEDLPEVVKRDAETLYEFLQRNMDGPEQSRRKTNHA